MIHGQFNNLQLSLTVADRLLGDVRNNYKIIEQNQKLKKKFIASKVYKKMLQSVKKYENAMNEFNSIGIDHKGKLTFLILIIDSTRLKSSKSFSAGAVNLEVANKVKETLVNYVS